MRPRTTSRISGPWRDKLGLRLPRTLVTNKPRRRARVHRRGRRRQGTVFKAFLASIEAGARPGSSSTRTWTQLDLVRYAPVIFQEYIAGVDLRVTIVGDQVFAAEIDARETTYPVDMRMVVGEATCSR